MPLAQDIAKKLSPHHRLLTTAFYVGAAVLLCIFPSFDKHTEIEEHGLVSGYADAGFHGPWSVRLRETMNKMKQASSISAALDAALLDAHLPAYHSNFSTLGVRGSLTYTLVSSTRGDSREATVVVIATNWTARKEAISQASWGLGVGVTLAQYLKQVKWLSKDVFFVFVDRSLAYGAGTRAWLHAYFGGSSAVRRGVLRQAVVLDAVSRPTTLVCDVEGVNGMVPNQDVVNSYVVEATRTGLPIEHRHVWDSVVHHVRNGGVHSLHAPFLEAHVPAFTVRARRPQRTKGDIDPDAIARSLEGFVRDLSNNLQQLHHSFNFYFFTGQKRHISSGLYLYPVFAMQLPLLSYLLSSPAYRDIRSLLVGLGLNAAIATISGCPIFLLATSTALAPMVQDAGLSSPLVCERPSALDEELRRRTAAVWLACAAIAALLLMLGLRRYAFRIYEEEDSKPDTVAARGQGVRLPFPLWESMHATSGFAYLSILAPVTIASWAVAVPLTLVIVPLLILVRPFSIRRRPLRSLVVFTFLLGNLFLFVCPPAIRNDIFGDAVSQSIKKFHAFFYDVIVPVVPREGRRYLPTSLLDWIVTGSLTNSFGQDLLPGLFEIARDFNCVGGMLFPIFCFCYWPFLVLLALIGGVLPAQRVSEEGLSLRQVQIATGFTILLLVGAFAGAIVWRSTSSSGLGELQW